MPKQKIPKNHVYVISSNSHALYTDRNIHIFRKFLSIKNVCSELFLCLKNVKNCKLLCNMQQTSQLKNLNYACAKKIDASFPHLQFSLYFQLSVPNLRTVKVPPPLQLFTCSQIILFQRPSNRTFLELNKIKRLSIPTNFTSNRWLRDKTKFFKLK